MRYKAMPLTVRSSQPGEGRPIPPAPARRRYLDWLISLPVALLVPALILPFVPASAGAPQLAFAGPVVPGTKVMLVGSGFPTEARIVFRWDGERVEWLDGVRTGADGAFEERVRIRATVTPGVHLLEAHRRYEDRSLSEVLLAVPVTVEPAPADSASPTPTPSPSPSPSPTPTPTPTPTLAPATSTTTSGRRCGEGIVGYGAGTTGGAGGTVYTVTSLADAGPGSLREAVGRAGRRIVRFAVGGTIRLTSGDIAVGHGDVTIDGTGQTVTLRGGTLSIRASNVIVCNLRFRVGDEETDAPADQDGLTINGGTGAGISKIVLDRVEAVWGPDIGGLALLNRVTDVTIQESVFGVGLYLSRHPEAVTDQGGHSLGLNVANVSDGTSVPERVTLWRNLLVSSEARMPQLQGGRCLDLLNNVIYNWATDSAHGNPRAANVVANRFRSGPLTSRFTIWRGRTSADNPSFYPASVYLAANVADGFSPLVAYGAGQAADGPTCPLSVVPGPAPAVADLVATVGPRPLDPVTSRWLADVTNRTGGYWNGVGEPAPNPYWP